MLWRVPRIRKKRADCQRARRRRFIACSPRKQSENVARRNQIHCVRRRRRTCLFARPRSVHSFSLVLASVCFLIITPRIDGAGGVCFVFAVSFLVCPFI